MTKQHHFAHALLNNLSRFANDLGELPAALRTTRGGHNAVRAAIVAPALHRNPGLHTVKPLCRHVLVVLIEVEVGEHGALAAPRALHERRQGAIPIRPDDETHVLGILEQAGPKSLRHATGDADNRVALHEPLQLAQPAASANGYLWWGSVGALASIGQGVVIFFLVYFLLASGDLYKRKLLKLAGPSLSEKKLSIQILNEIEGQIGRFLLVQIFTSVVVSLVTWLALKFLGVNQPAVWGIAAGVLNSIPYFGAIMVSGGLALVAFLQFGTLSMALYVSAVTFVITSLEGFLLTPALMGKASRINQVALFVGILFWGWMWGVVGMILAVPIMMAMRSVADRVDALWQLAEVLGEKSTDAAGAPQRNS